MSAATEPSVYFGERVDRYDRDYDRVNAFGGYALHSRMNAVLRLLGSGGREVLDAGMGPGRLCRELANRGWQVSGVDAAPAMVAAARERVPEAASRLVCGQVERLPFADSSFDAVVATGILEYAGVEAALQEFVRVLRPGGRAVFSYPNSAALYGRWKTRLMYPVVRAVKRALGRSPLIVATAPPSVDIEHVSGLIAASGLTLEQREFASYAVVLWPLDAIMPRVAVKIARHVEHHHRRCARSLATQTVYATRKP